MGIAESASPTTTSAQRRLDVNRSVARFQHRFHLSVRSVAAIFGVVAAAVAALGSWIPSFWGDEVTSVLSAERSLPSLFRMLGNVDAVHGTYYLLMHFWVALFGASPFSMRLPSAIAVGIAVAGVVLLAERLADYRTAVIAGIVAVVLPRITYMGEEARGYALSAACVVWLSLLLVRILSSENENPRRRAWILYGVGVAVCAYVFLFSLLFLVAHAAIVFQVRRRPVLRSWFFAVLGGLVIALPVIGYGIGERGQIAFLAHRDAAGSGALFVGQWFGNDIFAGLAWLLVLAAFGLALVAEVRRRRSLGSRFGGSALETPESARANRVPSLVVLAAFWSLGSMIILVGANQIYAVYSSRYLSFAAPGVVLLIAWVLAKIQQRWIIAVLLIALIGSASTSYFSDRTPYAKNNSDWAQVSAVIAANAKPGDGILFDEGTRPSRALRLAMRGYPKAYVGLKDIALNEQWWQTTNWHDSVYPLSQVQSRLAGVETVWMLEFRDQGGKPSTFNLDVLAANGYSIVDSFPEHGSVVLKLVRG